MLLLYNSNRKQILFIAGIIVALIVAFAYKNQVNGKSMDDLTSFCYFSANSHTRQKFSENFI